MISIIIPVYKSEKTLERCIRSACEQTYQDLEIIIIVDGFGDMSGKLSDEYSGKDSRIRVIHQENQGVSAARNAGIDAANGQYIQFLDSDDYLENDACEKMLNAIEEGNEDMVIAGFHHLYFGKDIVKIPAIQGCYHCKDSEKEFLQLYEQQFLNMPWNKLYRAELVKERFPRNMNLGEDLLFNITYMSHIRSFFVMPAPMYHYIQDDRGTTLSTQKRNDRIEVALYLYHTLCDFCKNMWTNTSRNSEQRKTVLKSKVVVEFLDALEGLAFESQMRKDEKIEVIKQYYDAWNKIPKQDSIQLKLLDYKIIYYFFTRKRFTETYIMIVLRGIVVKIVRRMTCSR